MPAALPGELAGRWVRLDTAHLRDESFAAFPSGGRLSKVRDPPVAIACSSPLLGR